MSALIPLYRLSTLHANTEDDRAARRTYHGCSSSQSLKKSNSKRSIAAPAPAAPAAATAAGVGG